jgi:hypothetical protein
MHVFLPSVKKASVISCEERKNSISFQFKKMKGGGGLKKLKCN